MRPAELTQKCRMSVDEKLDSLTDTLKVMQDMMLKKGFYDQDPEWVNAKGSRKDGRKPEKRKGKDCDNNKGKQYESETTVDHNLLRKGNEEEQTFVYHCDPDDPEILLRQNNRESTSSEDQIDTSDEIVDDELNTRFISDCAAEAERRHSLDKVSRPEPETGWGVEMIRDVKASKKRMLATKGNYEWDNQINAHICDENYQIIGGNVDQALRSKIINHEYMVFSKLIPRDQVSTEDDHRMELISKGGQTFFVPVSDLEVSNIGSFNKWEQAFRVFSNVYTQEFPHRASELIQYNQVIFAASQSFVWENIYHYDKEFRHHLSHFPQ